MSRNDSNWVASNLALREELYKMKDFYSQKEAGTRKRCSAKKQLAYSKGTLSLQEIVGL